MIKFRLYVVRMCILLFAGLALTGCLSRSSPDVSYYSMLGVEQLGGLEPLGNLAEVKLGVGPVSIPDSLKRSQVATRNQGNRYSFDEFNRWAGVLEKDIAMVLGDNLGQLLGVENVAFYPWMPHFKPTYRVMVDVQRLDGSLDGEAVLIARWSVADAEGKNLLAAKKSDYRKSLEDPSYASLIRAESALVADLSKEIAGVILTLQ